MKCDNCHNEGVIIAAVIGNHYGSYCSICIGNTKRLHHVGSAQYSRDRDREAHEVDMLQPWDSKGNPSKEFINHYPDEAHDIFTQEELERHG